MSVANQSESRPHGWPYLAPPRPPLAVAWGAADIKDAAAQERAARVAEAYDRAEAQRDEWALLAARGEKLREGRT